MTQLITKRRSDYSLDEVHGSVETEQMSWWRRILAFSGPAFLISVGYMDPGNWGTDLAAGSGFGYELAWVLLLSNLMALLLQYLSAKLGIVRGRDLAQVSKEMYPPVVNIILYAFAEIAIAACDLAEVLGLAIGLNLLFHLPIIDGAALAVLDCILLIGLMQLGIRKLEAVIVSLVFVIGISFFVELIFARPSVSDLMIGFLPSIPNDAALYIAIGIIGATVMPHNLYLHSALVQTRRIENNDSSKKNALRYNLADSAVALNLAFLVNVSILVLAAAVFFRNNLTEITDLRQAHQLLAPLLGSSLAPILFAVALIASGQSSTITGTLAGQVVMEGYLNLRIAPWLRRLITRLLAVIPTLIVLEIYGEGKTGDLLIFSQVILSLQLGFSVIPLIHAVSNKQTMRSFAIKPFVKILAWLCAAIILGLNFKYVSTLVSLWLSNPAIPVLWKGFILAMIAGVVLVLLYVLMKPLQLQFRREKVSVHTSTDLSAIQQVLTYERVAVAVDFSEKDTLTIRNALNVGGKNAEYILIHIVESAGAKLFGKEISDLETRSDIQQLDQYITQLQNLQYQVRGRIGFGMPGKIIPKLIAEEHANLLVLGAHGHRAIRDLIFGETINQVRHRVKIPILVAK